MEAEGKECMDWEKFDLKRWEEDEVNETSDYKGGEKSKNGVGREIWIKGEWDEDEVEIRWREERTKR